MGSEIKNRFTGEVIWSGEASSTYEAVKKAVDAKVALRGADLSDADLSDAYLRGADLSDANLSGADLIRAYLSGADLSDADLIRADLSGADLSDAYLSGADLRGADLSGAILPDGRAWELYKLDPLAGICDEPAARDRAVAAWGNHTWRDCPMHAAHGWSDVGDAPADKQIAVAAFVAVFDADLLSRPDSSGGDAVSP